MYREMQYVQCIFIKVDERGQKVKSNIMGGTRRGWAGEWVGRGRGRAGG